MSEEKRAVGWQDVAERLDKERIVNEKEIASLRARLEQKESSGEARAHKQFLLDEFARCALAGILANPNLQEENTTVVATTAYQYARQMLEARKATFFT